MFKLCSNGDRDRSPAQVSQAHRRLSDGDRSLNYLPKADVLFIANRLACQAPTHLSFRVWRSHPSTWFCTVNGKSHDHIFSDFLPPNRNPLACESNSFPGIRKPRRSSTYVEDPVMGLRSHAKGPCLRCDGSVKSIAIRHQIFA
jgi:hypothetical protein